MVSRQERAENRRSDTGHSMPGIYLTRVGATRPGRNHDHHRTESTPKAPGISQAATGTRGLPIGRPTALTDSQVRQAQQLRASGEPIPEIAATLGVSRATLYRALAERD